MLLASPYFAGCSAKTDLGPDHMTGILSKAETLPESGEQKIMFLDSSFRKIDKPTALDRIRYYSFKTSHFGRTQDYMKGLIYADSIISLTEEYAGNSEMARWLASAYLSKGNFFLLMGRYDECLFYFAQGRQIMLEKAPDNCKSSGYLGQIANALFAQRHYQAAASYYLQACTEDTLCYENEFVKFTYKQSNLDNVGICYSRLNMWDSASVFYDSTLKIIHDNEYRFPRRAEYMQIAKAVVWGNQAGYFTHLGKYNLAESLYIKSTKIIPVDDSKFAQTLRLDFAELYRIKGDTNKEVSVLNEVGNSLKRLPGDQLLQRYYLAMAQYHERQNEKGKSNIYLNQYALLSDSIHKRDELFRTMDVNAQLDNRYQKALNENLEKDNKLKKIYIVAFALLAVLSVVIFSLLFINHRKTNLLNRKLDLEAERERISKELHDDLGSSLTSMQILAKKLMASSGEQHQEILNNIVNITDGSIDQMGEIIWMLNDTTGSLGGLIAHLRAYMADYIQTTGLQLSLDFKNNCKEDCHLSNAQRRNLLLVFKEIFHNVVKHARATEFSLDCTSEDQSIYFVAHDNGIGLSPNDPGAGRGIGHIKTRIEDIGGNVLFHSHSGVEIKISIPKIPRK